MIRAIVLTYFLTSIAGAASAGMPMPDTSSATILNSENRKAVGKTGSYYYYEVIKDYCERVFMLDSLDVLEKKNKISLKVALANWPNELERKYGRQISSIMTDYSGAEASSTFSYEQLVRFGFSIFPKMNKEDLLKLAAMLSRPFYVNQEDKDIFWASTSATAASLPYISNEKDLLESILSGAILLKGFNVKPSDDVATFLKAAFSNQSDNALELIRAYDPYVDGMQGWCKLL